MRVLVVDDHRNTRESLALGFARLGHIADVAGNGEEAVGCLRQQTYGWMVCDVRMPGMSGLELAVTARQHQPKLGLVLMTAYDVAEDERRLIDALGGRLVIKPATAAGLVTLCERTDALLAQEETHS